MDGNKVLATRLSGRESSRALCCLQSKYGVATQQGIYYSASRAVLHLLSVSYGEKQALLHSEVVSQYFPQKCLLYFWCSTFFSLQSEALKFIFNTPEYGWREQKGQTLFTFSLSVLISSCQSWGQYISQFLPKKNTSIFIISHPFPITA